MTVYPGGLKLTLASWRTGSLTASPLQYNVGERFSMPVYLTKNGQPYYAGGTWAAQGWYGANFPANLYFDDVKVGSTSVTQGSGGISDGGWGGLCLFDGIGTATTPGTIHFRVEYSEDVTDPNTRTSVIDKCKLEGVITIVDPNAVAPVCTPDGDMTCILTTARKCIGGKVILTENASSCGYKGAVTEIPAVVCPSSCLYGCVDGTVTCNSKPADVTTATTDNPCTGDLFGYKMYRANTPTTIDPSCILDDQNRTLLYIILGAAGLLLLLSRR